MKRNLKRESRVLQNCEEGRGWGLAMGLGQMRNGYAGLPISSECGLSWATVAIQAQAYDLTHGIQTEGRGHAFGGPSWHCTLWTMACELPIRLVLKHTLWSLTCALVN